MQIADCMYNIIRTDNFKALLLIDGCQLPIADRSLKLQVYHKYKVLATKFLEKEGNNGCIKNEHRVYHKRTASYFRKFVIHY